LSPELIKQAEDELNEKEKWRERDIQALRDMVLAHKGLKARTDDAFLLRFLRARKFDYDRSYALLINYYTVRAQNPDIFSGLKFDMVEHIYGSGILSVLPQRDSLGRNVVYFRPGKWNPNDYPVTHVMRAFLVTQEILQLSEETQVSGVVVIENMTDVGLAHARSLDQKFAKLMTTIMQEAFPMRLKAMHFVNEPVVFGAVFSLIKPFLKEKLVKRLNFHGSSVESLHKHFSVDMLPEEVGGKMPSGDKLAQAWKVKAATHPEVFEDFDKYKIELTSDITKTKSAETTECLAGTYRKLNID